MYYKAHPPVSLFIHRTTHPAERIPGTGFWRNEPDGMFHGKWQVQIRWNDLPQDFKADLLKQNIIGRDIEYLIALVPDEQVTFAEQSTGLLPF